MQKATSLYGIEHAMIVASLPECVMFSLNQFQVRKEAPGNKPNVLIINSKKNQSLRRRIK